MGYWTRVHLPWNLLFLVGGTRKNLSCGIRWPGSKAQLCYLLAMWCQAYASSLCASVSSPIKYEDQYLHLTELLRVWVKWSLIKSLLSLWLLQTEMTSFPLWQSHSNSLKSTTKLRNGIAKTLRRFKRPIMCGKGGTGQPQSKSMWEVCLDAFSFVYYLNMGRLFGHQGKEKSIKGCNWTTG